MIKVKFIKALYPYSEGDVAEIKEHLFDKRKNEGYFEAVEKKAQAPKENKSMENKAKKNKSL
jgi:hypothetical protein